MRQVGRHQSFGRLVRHGRQRRERADATSSKRGLSGTAGGAADCRHDGEGALFVVAAGVTLLLVTGMNVLTPVLPLYAQTFHISTAVVGLVVGAFAGGRLLFDAYGGVLADRFGIKPVAASGCVIIAAASVIGGMTNAVWVLVVARTVQGVGSALYVTSAMSMVIATAPADKMGKRIAHYQGVFIFGLAIGPVVGGAVAHQYGMRSPFYAYAAMATIGLFMVLVAFPTVTPTGTRVARNDRGTGHDRSLLVRAALRTSALQIALVVTLAMAWVRAGVRNTVLPLYAVERVGMDASAVGILIALAAIGNILVVWHSGRVLDRVNPRQVLVASVVATGATVIAFSVANLSWSLYSLAVVLGGATGYASVTAVTMLASVADKRIRGTAVGIQRMSLDLGILVGSIGMGGASALMGYSSVFVVAGLAVMAVAVIAVRAPSRFPTEAGE